ncbi:nucleotide disphospho-sugar-binding domain-containing protein [Labedaea rhizosphaerae]|uniref:UDP:flavonoid glycosyltransferase YjiC (YdhE family) n=1 Tax=Labedaea rhizosphaerae TaxID=598644 RepID=A0A4R6S2I7_LABRH|nr:nucleotide disphospho-sugar-binding domain-containing protein [Labedaea rhizosphaerae]TDP92866.1 UDP:flavonoid glycosyltransferase YjiC (YdhE family) [Labedaea rhizosphaerae]
MRVLFTVSAWPTHYASMIPMGWALQAMGHEVRVLCPPSQAAQLTGAGLIPVPVPAGMDVVTRNCLQYYQEAVTGIFPFPWLPLHPVTREPMTSLADFDVEDYRRTVEPELARETGRGCDAAVGFARRWRPDVVVHDPTSLEGLLAAKVCGVPAVLSLWGPVGTDELAHNQVVPNDFSGAFPRYGFGEFSTAMIEHVVDPCPAPLAPRTKANRLPVRYVPYNGCAPAPDWLLEPVRRPRVCLTWSTALATMIGPAAGLLPHLLAVLSEMDCEVVVTATARDLTGLGPVPSSVRVLERLPLHLLLPSCAAVVHHGGSGTAMTALCAGVPQLAITFLAETTLTGARLAAAGAGRHLMGHEATATAVHDGVAALLASPRYRVAAGHLAAEIRLRPTMADLVHDLEKLAVPA